MTMTSINSNPRHKQVPPAAVKHNRLNDIQQKLDEYWKNQPVKDRFTLTPAVQANDKQARLEKYWQEPRKPLPGKLAEPRLNEPVDNLLPQANDWTVSRLGRPFRH
jgi:isochorismate hydrolase